MEDKLADLIENVICSEINSAFEDTVEIGFGLDHILSVMGNIRRFAK